MSVSFPALRIFVVENDHDTLRFLTMLLESFGHQVQSAVTMRSALESLPRACVDVLISDIGLPDGDGWEMMRRLWLPRPVYAIATSGYGTAQDVRRSLDAGFRHHLVKPFSAADLKCLLENAALEIMPTAMPCRAAR
ncbi:MAG TPA: response regulator [Gemmatimonadaceae bacterium]|nr:response regulator [Gemmatimonadaceae bacterium]